MSSGPCWLVLLYSYYTSVLMVGKVGTGADDWFNKGVEGSIIACGAGATRLRELAVISF